MFWPPVFTYNCIPLQIPSGLVEAVNSYVRQGAVYVRPESRVMDPVGQAGGNG
jgi:hypothetical protein